MECVVEHKVNVVLCVLQSNILASPSWNELNVPKAWECEVQSIILYPASVGDGQALELSRLDFTAQVLLLNFISFVSNDLEFCQSVKDAHI